LPVPLAQSHFNNIAVDILQIINLVGAGESLVDPEKQHN